MPEQLPGDRQRHRLPDHRRRQEAAHSRSARTATSSPGASTSASPTTSSRSSSTSSSGTTSFGETSVGAARDAEAAGQVEVQAEVAEPAVLDLVRGRQPPVFTLNEPLKVKKGCVARAHDPDLGRRTSRTACRATTTRGAPAARRSKRCERRRRLTERSKAPSQVGPSRPYGCPSAARASSTGPTSRGRSGGGDGGPQPPVSRRRVRPRTACSNASSGEPVRAARCRSPRCRPRRAL